MAEDLNKGKEVVTGSATYEGETLDGMKHGEGTLTWDDGDKFEGIFQKDEKVRGTFTYVIIHFFSFFTFFRLMFWIVFSFSLFLKESFHQMEGWGSLHRRVEE
jgi:hypothetical protein